MVETIMQEELALRRMTHLRDARQIFLRTLARENQHPEGVDDALGAAQGSMQIVVKTLKGEIIGQKESMVHLEQPARGDMHIFVKTLMGESIIWEAFALLLELRLRGGAQFSAKTLTSETIIQKESWLRLALRRCRAAQIFAKTLPATRLRRCLGGSCSTTP